MAKQTKKQPIKPHKIRIHDGFCAWEYTFTEGGLLDTSIDDIANLICKEYGVKITSSKIVSPKPKKQTIR